MTVGAQNQDGLSGFLDQIQFLLKQDPAPLVLTTSFGFEEAPFAEQAPDLAQWVIFRLRDGLGRIDELFVGRSAMPTRSSVPAARPSSLHLAMVACPVRRRATRAMARRSPPPSHPAAPCECILPRTL